MPVTHPPRPDRELLPTATLRCPDLPAGITAVEVRRSDRRRRTVSARVEGDAIVILLPATLSASQEQDWVDRMVARLGTKRERPFRSDDDLADRAVRIARRHLDLAAGRQLRPTSVRWSTTMEQRWGSCSTDSGAIRVSHRLAQMPDYVLDYVLAHELVHLLEPSHGPLFRKVLAAYPRTERAEGYLDGWAAGASRVGISGPEQVDEAEPKQPPRSGW